MKVTYNGHGLKLGIKDVVAGVTLVGMLLGAAGGYFNLHYEVNRLKKKTAKLERRIENSDISVLHSKMNRMEKDVSEIKTDIKDITRLLLNSGGHN